MFEHLLLVVLSGIGFAVFLVEKGHEWPGSFWKDLANKVLTGVHKQAPNMLDCVVCTSFWATLLVEAVAYFITGWFLFPMTGFISLFLSWFVMEFLFAVEKRVQ